jgi:hypothetical protein
VAHLLQGLIAVLFFASAAAAQEKVFSHRQHLALKLVCATCHQTATTSTRAEDNNLPSASVCAGCHTDGRAARASAKRQVDNFNHQVHMKFGNAAPLIRAAIAGKQYLGVQTPRHLDTTNNCAGCHHGIEQSDDVKAASVFPLMADCLICHNKMDTPFSCEKCHNNVPALKPANHSRDFIDRHNRKNEGLDRSTCFTCHGKQFTCLGCH